MYVNLTNSRYKIEITVQIYAKVNINRLIMLETT